MVFFQNKRDWGVFSVLFIENTVAAILVSLKVHSSHKSGECIKKVRMGLFPKNQCKWEVLFYQVFKAGVIQE